MVSERSRWGGDILWWGILNYWVCANILHSGLVLLLIPNRKVKKVANIVLLLTKVLNLYSHFAIEDLFERMAPTLVFFFMLVCRMVVDWQFDKTLAAEKVKYLWIEPNQTNRLVAAGRECGSWGQLW